MLFFSCAHDIIFKNIFFIKVIKMKWLASVCLSIFTFIATLITPSYVADVPEVKDDDFIPVMRFVATSDTHINTIGDTGCRRLSKMIKTAYAVSDNDKDYKKLDAVVFAGDITDNGMRDSFYAFAGITNVELREGTERLGIIAKSHDSYTYGRNSRKVFTLVTGQEADFHRVINDFHFIGISRSEKISQYTEEQAKWLDENIASAVKEDPEKPVFVFQHEHVLDTVYGSSSTDGWGIDFFSEVLNKYPQVVHISGHSHFPANDPRAIWQGSFTAINDGGLAYFELAVDGKNNQFPDGKDTMSQALIIEVDKDNRVLVKVLDVDAGRFVKEFLIDNISDVNKEKYNPEKRKEKSSAPVFENGAEIEIRKEMAQYYVTVPQAKVSGDNEVFIYRISVTDKNGKEIYKSWEFSGYFFAEKPEKITFDSFIILKNEFTVNVTAEDVWGNSSEVLSAKY